MKEQEMGLAGKLIALPYKWAGGNKENSLAIAGASIGVMIIMMLISSMVGLRMDNALALSENIQMSNTGIGNIMIHYS